VLTYSGQLVELTPTLGPPEALLPRDIAHHLALLPALGGASRVPYSLAQHSLLVAQHVGCWDGRHFLKYEGARLGLLMDAPCAYYGAPTLPLPAATLQSALVVLCTRFGTASEVTPEIEDAVNLSTTILLATERRDLLQGRLLNTVPDVAGREIEPMRKQIGEPWTWRTAEEKYLEAFGLLFGVLS
jgi:hypothetical protein